MSEESLVDIVEKATKTVVNISTLKVFHDVLYRIIPVKGMGSGFVFQENGYILTNSHVVEGARNVMVILTDGHVLEGRLIGDCRTADIAVIKVDADNLPVAELGDSDKLRVGQRVFAIGNPFGLAGGPTVTSGVVSALNRTIHSRDRIFYNLVQTDAAINPGNSGGPLINTEGKVIAISTAIIPYAQGIGFAIPINVAKTCSREIVLHGTVRRPWLGITGLNINDEIADYYRLPVSRGILVVRVAPESPAYKAGLEKGDIILKFDDGSVARIEDLQTLLSTKKPGDRVLLNILKGLKEKMVEVVLERMP
ncbi:trypsin-like peptidase domain-containing protein [Candidatus Bathyarchaeota archaeon]|nr:trypsin-like peptidase domain-containing protein [Candidatus Bathyarchaeota archaeon]